MPHDETELLKMRLDYAWNYFESAARQRMLFINYFLVAVGILASAYGLALKEELYPVACFVCVFGIVASIGFMVLDHRMLMFVLRALFVLEALERDELFPDGMTRHGPTGPIQNTQLGLARTEPDEKLAGKTPHTLSKVKHWIRLIQVCAALGFLLGLLYSAVLWNCA